MRLGSLLNTGDLICMEGDLGTGKTTFVQGVAAGWKSYDSVSSPTFVLINIYRRQDGQQMAHLDTYRLNSEMEALDLDLDALLLKGPLLVEWADRISSVLPDEHLWVKLDHVDIEQRNICFSAAGKHYQEIMGDLRKLMFGAT